MIKRIRQYRADTGHPLCFTLDAGPNIHLLYPEEIIHEVRAFIDEQLKPLCANEWVIGDWVGEGPEEM
jgi:diphosphomevalonate decarboxylase